MRRKKRVRAVYNIPGTIVLLPALIRVALQFHDQAASMLDCIRS